MGRFTPPPKQGKTLGGLRDSQARSDRSALNSLNFSPPRHNQALHDVVLPFRCVLPIDFNRELRPMFEHSRPPLSGD